MTTGQQKWPIYIHTFDGLAFIARLLTKFSANHLGYGIGALWEEQVIGIIGIYIIRIDTVETVILVCKLYWGVGRCFLNSTVLSLSASESKRGGPISHNNVCMCVCVLFSLCVCLHCGLYHLCSLTCALYVAFTCGVLDSWTDVNTTAVLWDCLYLYVSHSFFHICLVYISFGGASWQVQTEL